MAPVTCGCNSDAEPVTYKKTQSFVDSLEVNIGLKDVAKAIFAMVTDVMDEVTDITVAVTYFNDGDIASFALILAILLISSLSTTVISLYWYAETTAKLKLEVSPRQWFLRFLFHIFQCGKIWRHLEYIACIWKSRRKHEDREKYAQYLVLMKQESALLGLFSSYLESAPELLVQLCLLATPTPGMPSEFKLDLALGLRVLSIAHSLLSLARTVPELQDTIRELNLAKPSIPTSGKVFRFLWHYCSNLSRAIALSLFASVFPVYAILVCAGHWAVVTIWLWVLKFKHFERFWEEVVFKPIFGLVYIFTFLKIRKGPTLKAVCVFYVAAFLEGSVMMFVWIQYCDPDLWFIAVAYAGFFASFFVGVSFMGMFYCVFHPSRNGNAKSTEDLPLGVYEEQLNNHVTLYEMEHPPSLPIPCMARRK